MSRGWPRNVAGIRWHHELYGLIHGQVALPIVIIWQLISIRNVIYCTAVHASEFLRVRKFWKEQHVSRVWHWLEDLFWFRCYLVCGHLGVGGWCRRIGSFQGYYPSVYKIKTESRTRSIMRNRKLLLHSCCVRLLSRSEFWYYLFSYFTIILKFIFILLIGPEEQFGSRFSASGFQVERAVVLAGRFGLSYYTMDVIIEEQRNNRCEKTVIIQRRSVLRGQTSKRFFTFWYENKLTDEGI